MYSWLAQLAVHQGALETAGVHIVAVFLATPDSLYNHFGNSLPFHILADEDGRVHRRYGLSTEFVRGSCLSADFMVNPDLRLEAAYYCTHNRNPAISDILSWGRVTHGKINGTILWSEGV